MYELARIYIAQGYKIGILTRPIRIKNQFYYSRLIELGCSIHTRLITLRHIKFFLRWVNADFFSNSSQLRKFYRILSKFLWWSTLKNYDSIYVIGMETYCDSFGVLHESDIAGMDIEVFHVMHRFQQDRDYCAEYNLNKIVVVDQKQERELESSIPNIKIKRSNLFLNFDDLLKFDLVNPPLTRGKKILNIGVISRLSQDRPNEVLFRYFSEISKKFKSHLHWYGGGNKNLYDDLCKSLSIGSDDVTFHGHTHDIIGNFKRDLIDLCWQTCMGSSLNYAPIELMGMRFPVLLINIDPDFTDHHNHPCQIVKSVDETIKFHQKIIQNPKYLNDIALTNYDYAFKTYSADDAYTNLKKLGLA